MGQRLQARNPPPRHRGTHRPGPWGAAAADRLARRPGAAAAFGFSRKLRQRITTAQADPAASADPEGPLIFDAGCR